MRLNTKDRTDLLLSNYPYPFLRDGIFNRVAVVLPKERDDYTYRSLGNVFNMLGQFAGGNTGDVHFYSDNAGADNLKDNNIIAIGSYKNNKVIRDNNGKLFSSITRTGQPSSPMRKSPSTSSTEPPSARSSSWNPLTRADAACLRSLRSALRATS